MIKNKTTITQGNNPKRNWVIVDLSGQTLGRVCTKMATILVGKDNPAFSYHRDDGGYVIAINADKILVTGKKLREKIYYSYSNFPGGLKALTLKELMAKDSRKVIYHGVLGMVPKNRLRKIRMARLKIFKDATHPFAEKLTK